MNPWDYHCWPDPALPGVPTWSVTDTYGGTHTFTREDAARQVFAGRTVRADLDGHTVTLTDDVT